MTAAAAARPFRPDIDGLGAVAVLAVLGYHAFPGYLPLGRFGVDFNFVTFGYRPSFCSCAR